MLNIFLVNISCIYVPHYFTKIKASIVLRRILPSFVSEFHLFVHGGTYQCRALQSQPQLLLYFVLLPLYLLLLDRNHRHIVIDVVFNWQFFFLLPDGRDPPPEKADFSFLESAARQPVDNP